MWRLGAGGGVNVALIGGPYAGEIRTIPQGQRTITVAILDNSAGWPTPGLDDSPLMIGTGHYAPHTHSDYLHGEFYWHPPATPALPLNPDLEEPPMPNP